MSFLNFGQQTCQSPFRGWLITATTSRNQSAISQKEAIESPELERFWLIKYQTKDKRTQFANRDGKIAVTCFDLTPHRVSGRISIAFIQTVIREIKDDVALKGKRQK